MKFIDTSGCEHSIDIRPSRWPKKAKGRGKFQTQVGDIIAELFPGDIVLEEFPCKGERLFLDFFLPRSLIAVEVQGRQHHKYVEFFHGTKANFLKQKAKDRRKAQWCELNKIQLIKIDYGIPEETIKEILLDAK